MNYVGLRRGQHMPAVGVAQKLLNRFDAGLVVDGAFGRRTSAAVRDFQRLHGLGVDGIIGQKTWPRLCDGLSLPIGDSIDLWERGKENVEATTLRQAGIDFYGAPAVSAHVSTAIRGLMSYYRGANLFLLRFHGHGRPGSQNVIGGLDGDDLHASLNRWILTGEGAAAVLADFRTMMGSIGSIMLNGCRVGAGSDGRALVERFARMTGYPVVAGLRTQWGGASSTFYMEGPVVVGLPRNGMSLKDWCDGLPAFPEKILSSSPERQPPPMRRMLQSRPPF